MFVQKLQSNYVFFVGNFRGSRNFYLFVDSQNKKKKESVYLQAAIQKCFFTGILYVYDLKVQNKLYRKFYMFLAIFFGWQFEFFSKTMQLNKINRKRGFNFL
eukprot:TRINITY_DN10730_c1_g3_i8.p11 TRINITY_DN10730_c1_g3~~TRINITY_DN10730_c1_g3_i8.p11  ORF type:complete len:102 (-),score=5.27 TRINITY_DN10730_c1_g3_i8:1418-1723(-)